MCGVRLSSKPLCSTCDAQNRVGARFCATCGTPMRDSIRHENSIKAADYVLEAKELGIGWKLAQLWWITPQKKLLKRISVCGNHYHLIMWNGDEYHLVEGQFTASWIKNPQQGDRRYVNISTPEGPKIQIIEMIPMYRRKDFTRLIEVLGAEETGLSKVLGMVGTVFGIAEKALGS
jgi:hypothetical protein